MGAICGLGFFTNLSANAGKWYRLTEEKCNHGKGEFFGGIKITSEDVKWIGLVVQYRCDWFLGCKEKFVVEDSNGNQYDLGSYNSSGTQWLVTDMFPAPKPGESVVYKLKSYENNNLTDEVSFSVTNVCHVSSGGGSGGTGGSYGGGGGIGAVPEHEAEMSFGFSNNLLLYVLLGLAIGYFVAGRR